MTATQHLDEQALIDAARNPDLTNWHIEQCQVCRNEFALWQSIAEAARVSVASVSLREDDDCMHRIMAKLDEAPPRSSTRPFRHGWRPYPTGNARWLVAALALALVVSGVVIALSVGSVTPSSASVLAQMRRAPGLIEAASNTVDTTSYATDYARNGYAVMNWRTRAVYSPHTNAFQVTDTTAYPGQLSSSLTYSSDGSLVYLPCNPSYETIGQKPCLAYPAQAGSTSDLLAFAFLREASGPVTRLGQRTIGGIETTGYALTVPAARFVAGAEPSERSLLGQEYATTKDLRLNIWSDRRGLPREIDYTLSFRTTSPPATLTETAHERLSYSQSIPHLTLPNRRSLLVAPSLQAAQQLTKTYGSQYSECVRSGAC